MLDEKIFAQVLDKLTNAFVKQMHFTRNFQLQVEEFDAEHIVMSFPMNEQLQGNFLQKILHGGATATVLDTAGGMVAIAANCAKVDAPVDQLLAKIAKAATVDMRVDYLRPGRGDKFYVEAKIVRCGNKVTSVDTFLYSETKCLLAKGAGTYIVG
jgi:uncharacterized protein (TIGR00369 family)